MIRLSLIIFVCIFSLLPLAWAKKAAEQEVQYQNLKIKPMPSYLQQKISEVFQKLNYKKVFIPKQGSEMLGINLLFTDAFFNSKIALKYDMQGDFELEKIYPVKNGHVYHFELDRKMALYFENIDESVILHTVEKIKKFPNLRQSGLPSSVFAIPQAYSDECTRPDLFNDLPLDNTVASQSAASMISGCMSEVASGAYDASIGTLEAIGTGIYDEWNTFWDNPTKRMGEYWGFVQTGLGAIWEFTKTLGEMLINPVKGAQILKQKFGELGSFFVGVYENIKALPFESQVNLFCNILGSIGVDVLITAVTVGAGGGKLAITITRLLAKLNKISTLVGKGIRYPFKILNELSDAILEKMQKIIKVGNKDILDRKIKDVGCAL